ncbi:MAG: penicillin-binding protein 2 [Lachnospiraceae bacterium]|nr:penicillin-binding protein 2 [Lachnospiraceae bacterium]
MWKKRMKSDGSDNTKEIIGVMVLFVSIFLAMIGYLSYFVATNEQEMINNSYNSRQKIILAKNYRGSIYSADGEVLAETVFTSDGKEKRNYPYKNMFSHVIGFSTYGRTGVEAASNYYLINSNISLKDKVANTTAGVKNPGDNVFTTLNTKLQQAAYNALGVYQGAVIVTECSTGRVLAMVSKPDFDPNEIADIWDMVAADTESSVLLNRATQGIYPPGSTFKMITALQYIRENPDTYSNYTYTCKGSYKYEGHTIQCYHGSVHNKVDFVKSFAKSCNTSFVNIGMELDKGGFASTLEQLLFNQDLKLDFATAKSKTPVSSDMSQETMLQVSIGQGAVQVSPIHLNMITAAIANNGMLMKPYIVDYIQSATGTMVQDYKDKEYGRLMSEEESSILRKMMIEVVENGTANRMLGYGYTAGGKTGSAEYNSNRDSHAWFTGFAPAENPEIAITIIIEGAGSGGDYAVPMARRILDAYFKE